MACFSSGSAASCSRQSLARALAWSANYTPTAPRRGLGELRVSGVNRDALVGHQPGQHTGAKIVCVSSAARRQNAFGCCATDLRQVCYSYFGTYATLPGHEGDERD